MKILVIRFSSIGDIVLTTPILRCLKQQLNNSQVHFLTKKAFLPVIEHNPYIDRVYIIENKVKEIDTNLQKENYDFIVDLHHNLRSAQVKSLLKKESSSFSKLNIEKWLMVNMKINKLPDIHIVDRYFNTIETLKVKNDGKGLDFFIAVGDEVDINTLPDIFKLGYIGFVVGAKFNTKQLPKEKIYSISKKITKPIIFLGGKEDFEKAEWIIQQLSKDGISEVFNACGKYTLGQSSSLVKQADKIITHDTGLMHIAAAFKKEIVSVWGNTIPEFGMYPYYGNTKVPNLISEVKNLSCRPCSKLGFPQCPKKHFKCMLEIDEKAIVQFINT